MRPLLPPIEIRALPALLAAVVALGLQSAETAAAPVDDVTPPPVSGRRLSAADAILPADVLARVELLRANVDLLRHYMGRALPRPPLLRAEGARPMEVYSQALNLQLRASRLAFEQVRVVRREPLPITHEARPADVFAVVDDALASVLLVKRHLGIDAALAEEIRPEATTPGEVFNATTRAASEINNLLQQKTSPSDVFQLVTASVHTAAALHTTIPGGPNLPEEPEFEPNKMPVDVYMRLERCFQIIHELARRRGLEILRFELAEGQEQSVTPADVSDLAVLIVEELNSLHALYPDVRTPARAYYPGARFPSHVYQRVGLLEAILEDLHAATGSSGQPSPGGA